MIPAIAALLLLSAVGFAIDSVVAAAAPPPPHNPILIDGPDDLATPDALSGNGIRGGRGTASDPYRISDWTIIEKPGIAHLVSIQNVDASFRFERLHLSASQNTTLLVSASSIAKIFLAENTFNNGGLRFASIPAITMQENVYEDVLFHAERIPSLNLNNETGSLLGVGIDGYHVGTTRISDSKFHIQDGFKCTGCMDTLLERSRLYGAESSGGGFLIQIIGGHGNRVRFDDVELDSKHGGIEITFQDSTVFNRAKILGHSQQYVSDTGIKVGENFTFASVSISGFRTGMEVTRLDRGAIQSSTFENISNEAIQLWENVAELVVERTTFSQVGCGIAAPAIPSEGGRPPAYRGKEHDIRDLRVHNSSFIRAERCGVFLNVKGSQGDARWNWWGGLGTPPIGWCFPKPGLVSPGIQIDPTLKSSPHGLSPVAQDRDECSRFPIPSPGATLIFGAALGALALTRWRRKRALPAMFS